MTDIAVSILVVSFNTRDLTLACLRSVYEQTAAENFELIVVDNASSDGSADAIAMEFPGVRLIRSPENLGFAQGNNVAAEHAVGEYLLLLNPDTVVLDRAIDRLLAFARGRPAAGIWGGRTVYADGSLNPASCWGRQTLWSTFCMACGLSSLFRDSRWFNTEGYGGWDRSTVRTVDIVSGCFFMIRRDFWQQLGGFHRQYFMYGEEADLCLRAKSRGSRPVVTPEAVIVHYGGASERVRADKMVRLLKAKCQLIKDHWRAPTRGLGLVFLGTWPLSRWLAWSCLRPLAGQRAMEAARCWRQVWSSRAQWL